MIKITNNQVSINHESLDMLITKYYDLTITGPGCHPGSEILVAKFKLDNDISHLFPYINAIVEKASYFENPHYIKFMRNGISCALYHDNAAVAPFGDREKAIEYIDGLIAFLNDLDKKKESLKPDHTTKKNIAVMDILRFLPRTNCGVCGFPTCMAFAAALCNGDTVIEDCCELISSNNKNLENLKSMF